jgi:hypothetical protein
MTRAETIYHEAHMLAGQVDLSEDERSLLRAARHYINVILGEAPDHSGCFQEVAADAYEARRA